MVCNLLLKVMMVHLWTAANRQRHSDQRTRIHALRICNLWPQVLHRSFWVATSYQAANCCQESAELKPKILWLIWLSIHLELQEVNSLQKDFLITMHNKIIRKVLLDKRVNKFWVIVIKYRNRIITHLNLNNYRK